jgi:hypothetical protein
LSIPCWGRPLHRAPHPRNVDTVEQHRELGRLDAQLLGAVFDDRHAKASSLEAFVEDDEAAIIPGQDLHAVAPARNENEERAAVDIFLPCALYEPHQPINASTQIDGLGGEQDAQRGG